MHDWRSRSSIEYTVEKKLNQKIKNGIFSLSLFSFLSLPLYALEIDTEWTLI